MGLIGLAALGLVTVLLEVAVRFSCSFDSTASNNQLGGIVVGIFELSRTWTMLLLTESAVTPAGLSKAQRQSQLLPYHLQNAFMDHKN